MFLVTCMELIERCMGLLKGRRGTKGEESKHLSESLKNVQSLATSITSASSHTFQMFLSHTSVS